MDSSNIVCPVCTLYLRPGITLRSHLGSHPKQKVIEALVKLAETEGAKHFLETELASTWPPPNPIQGNHVFIYQQSMSTTTPQPNIINPLSAQQYVIPAVFNPQMMPYVYQQQLILSSNSCIPQMKALPFEPSNLEKSSTIITEAIEETEPRSPEKEPEEEKDETWQEKETQTSHPSSSSAFSQPPDFYYPSNTVTTSFEEPVYQPNEQLDFVDIDGMHVIINDFQTNQIISQVENFDHTRVEKPVLMTIGEISNKIDYVEPYEESASRESNVNIRTDERMPPRGELSGQESIGGASDITWNRIQYQESSLLSSDLIRESWEGSDDDEDGALPSENTVDAFPPEQVDDTPTIVSYSGPVLNFKCSTCDEAFASCKERKGHELEKHPEKFKLVGADIGKKKVKKLVVKLKNDKNENNFDNVFTNKLKIEAASKEEVKEEAQIDDINLADVKSVCSMCDGVLESAQALKLHKIQVHKVAADVRHKCGTCGEVFQNEYKFTEHLRLHPLECRICGKLFYRRHNFQLHMKRHLGLKPYKCEVCGKCFITKQKHDEHKNTHTGEAPIKCNLCDETFRRHSNLVQHRNRHHFNLKKKVKDYICFCGEVFHSKKKLAWHKEIHDTKPKACTQCSEKFVHMSSLTRHMRRAHNDKFLPSDDRNNENVECPICKGVYLRSSLDVHIRNHSGRRPFTCSICNKDFTTKWNLKLHKWTHAARTAKPFKCDQCKGAFIRESDYVAHMNSHKSVRPYTCNYCGAQFIRKYNCQRHVKEHENGKTFNCQVCGKSFHRSYYLKDHMRVHSGIRPYVCHICGKTSTTKSNHNKHVQIHHAREPVSTEN